ncbi:uncharacterized protein LOC135478236 [Liolophura sinensis]|uniref:uncharacterized protein LOC135478236 n=1 Tax=Liolophura sinensis TaxID=3198878 RepID=UPI0031583478
MRASNALVCCGFLFLTQCSINIQAWSGSHVCSTKVTTYRVVRYCNFNWWGCWQHKYRRETIYSISQYCCPGWKHNGNHVCNIPVCLPQCYNGGTCQSPNKCLCPVGFNGDLCANPLCSYLKPCYPGTCGANTDDCTCTHGFNGASCLTFEPGEQPEVPTAQTVMYVVDPATSELFYSIETDATFPGGGRSEVFWTNLYFFNRLNITWESYYASRTDLPPLPSYITDVKFGIVESQAEVLHVKRQGAGWISDPPEIHRCQEHVISSDTPEMGILQCRLDAGRYKKTLEHEDMLNITVKSKNGGHRVIRKPDGSTFKQTYTGRWNEKQMQFRIDFREPFHCSINGTCSELPVSIHGPDIRKTGFTMKWPGWQDPLSGIERYTWRVFRLRADRDGNLTEVDQPVYSHQANGSLAGLETDNYTPDTAGMYSVYLQVSDKANNSRYARTLVLYDPSSQVEINTSPDAELFVSSASSEVDFHWQTNLQSPITVSWKKHFRNKFHEVNSLLNRVLPYPGNVYIKEIGDRKYVISKEVDDNYDDHEGNRTVDAIRNVHGIVKFEVARRTDKVLGTSCKQAPNSWNPVSDPWNEEHVFNLTRQDGLTVCIWIRASDVFGNYQIDLTQVHFDATAPEFAAPPEIERNKAPTGEPYHSRIKCQSRDPDSGVMEIRWRMRDNMTGEEFGRGAVDALLKEGEECSPFSKDCECSPSHTTNCYRRENVVYIPHCAINVTKDRVASLIVQVEVDSVNGAGLSSAVTTFQLGNISQLDGINEYVAPMNFQSHDTTSSSVTVQWDNPPSCYSLSAIRVAYRPVNGGQLHNYTSFKLSKRVSLNGLYRGTDYIMWIYNIYDKEVSDPSEYRFTTISYLASEIAGIVIGTLLLLAVAALVTFILVLWRRGQLRSTLERRLTRARTVLRNRVNRYSRATRILIFLMKRTIRPILFPAAKSQNENERLLMKAKINFMASNDLDHENVVRFIGAINDDEERGPIMLLEFCEMGPLKTWLGNQKTIGKIHGDVVDRMFFIVYGVAKGMEYLASRDIVHRKLAARNILLDFTLQPKIIGFGPVPDELAEEADNTTKGERLPLKWMAPELVKAKSTKKSNEKSDVWSYGVVVWETFSLGEAPYTGIKGGDLLKKLNQGYRLPRPEFMTDDYDVLTKRCWNQMPEDRPTFATLLKEQSKWFDNSADKSLYYDSSDLKNY